MLNIPVTSEERGWQVSELLYNLCKPEGVDWVTRYYGVVQQHPLTDIYYLRLPNDGYLPIAINATLGNLEQVFLEFVTEAEVETLKQVVIDHRGSSINPDDYLPAFWLSQAIPDSELDV